jgi:hypothetical protein
VLSVQNFFYDTGINWQIINIIGMIKWDVTENDLHEFCILHDGLALDKSARRSTTSKVSSPRSVSGVGAAFSGRKVSAQQRRNGSSTD